MKLVLKLLCQKNKSKGGNWLKIDKLAILKFIGSISLVFAGIIATPTCYLFLSQAKCPKSLQK